jgi:hypothetical protein
VAAAAASAELTSLIHEGNADETATVPAATLAVLMKSRREVFMELDLLMDGIEKRWEVFNLAR